MTDLGNLYCLIGSDGQNFRRRNSHESPEQQHWLQSRDALGSALAGSSTPLVVCLWDTFR